MEQIILGMFKSKETEKKKGKFFLSLKNKLKNILPEMTLAQKKMFYVVCLHYYIHGNDFEKTESRELSKKFISILSEDFGYILSFNDIDNMITTGNLEELFSSVKWPYEYIKISYCSSYVLLILDVISDILDRIPKTEVAVNIHLGCCLSVRNVSVKLVYMCEKLEECSKVSSFFTRYVDCIDLSKGQAICNIILRKISSFSYVNSEGKVYKNFVKDVGKVTELIHHIWNKQSKTILPTVMELFQILSKNQDEPSIALASFAEIIPVNLISNVFQDILQNSSVPNEFLVQGFNRMVKWITWPNSRLADYWILSFLINLKNTENFLCLIDVIYDNVKKMCIYIQYPNLRSNCCNMLEIMLLGYQHSPDAFHLIVPLIPKTISKIKEEDNVTNNDYLLKLNKLFRCLMYKFSGFPEKYKKVLEVLTDFPVIDEQEINAVLEKASWTSKSLSTSSHVYTQIDVRSRSSLTNKAGLTNLGNTCFANSIIQALYNAHSFKQAIAEQAKHCHEKSVHCAIEETFAYLQHTEREAYEPKDLIDISRPPWFVAGMQQDCSEYVKYLIDRLQEEQTSWMPSSPTCDLIQPKLRRMSRQTSNSQKTSKCNFSCQDMVTEELVYPVEMAMDTIPSVLHINMNTLFTGSMNVVMQCLKCESTSVIKEPFMDISLSLNKDRHDDVDIKNEGLKGGALPHASAGTSGVGVEVNYTNAEIKKMHEFENLLYNYLEDEILDGDNRYQCSICNSLQKAKKTTNFEELPHYLFFTLLRFTYDKKLQCRTKILDSVEIKPVIQVPVTRAGSTFPEMVTYKLWAVVVHSGSNADSGHYYSYALSTNAEFFRNNESCSSAEWYLYNDSNTSKSNLESIQKLSTTFQRDTVYMLMYTQAEKNIKEVETRQKVLSKVQNDNLKFRKEKETLVKRQANIEKESYINIWQKDNDDSDDEYQPQVRSCGANMNLSGGRVIF